MERWGFAARMPADLFTAIADPTRRRIVEMLAVHEGMAASDIYDQFEVSPQAISQHLKLLRETQLVQVEKRAQQRIYRLNPDALEPFEAWSRNVRLRWNRRLDAMEAMLKEEMTKAERAKTEKLDE